MSVGTLAIHNQLSDKLGREQVQLIIEFVQAEVQESSTSNMKEVATKGDIADLNVKLAEVKADLIKYMVGIGLSGFLALVAAILGLYFKH